MGKVRNKLFGGWKQLRIGHREPAATEVRGEQWNDLRNGRHIFLFGVWGRSSTTALQRILNSSGEVCIWGEPGDFLVDDLLGLHSRLQKKNSVEDSAYQKRKTILPQAFRAGNHSVNYAMAFPELRPTVACLEEAFIRMFEPLSDMGRFGFKEITVRSIETLTALRGLFPNAWIIFLFRNPVTQWPSVERMGWNKTDTLDAFLEEYQRLAQIYLQAGGLFVETVSLYDKAFVRRLCQHLGLAGFDESLINDGVFAKKDKKELDDAGKAQVIASPAWLLYQRMQALASAALERE